VFAAKDEMICPQCHTESPASAKFCLECGARLALTCPECATPLPPTAKFCPECGARLAAAPTVPDASPMALPERVRRLMPPEYVDRLLEAGDRMTGERRLVTILFADIKGSTAMAEKLDPEEVMEVMDGGFDALIGPIMRYEGTVARLMGDGVLAFFGAPLAHEDDAERACRAALEIVEGAQGYGAELEEEQGISGFGVRVGINTGLVAVGEVGTDLRVEYTAMGDAINLAARMEQYAPVGGILISHDTYRHVRGVFDVQPQEPLQVKGKAEPVQTYVVLRAKPRAFRLPTRGVEGIETRMVGRETELKWLQDAVYDAIEDSERQMVTIAGDAGVGKSRLLYEFDHWLELLPETVRYFKGRARQEMQSVPYALLRDLLGFRFKIRDSDTVREVQDRMVAGICEVLGQDEEGERKAHLVGHLIGFDFSESPHLRALRDDPQAVHQQALASLVQFFAAHTERSPTVIFLEDLHWCDDSSLDGISHLAEGLPDHRLLIVCAARPALFERRPHWGEGQTFHTRLELGPLSRRDGRRLVAEILQKMVEVPDTLRDLVVAGAEGNPFFIEELIKMLIEDGVVVKGEEVWRVEPDRLAAVRVPESLTGVLQARLDRLPLEERTILQQASVVGRLFWDRAVAHIGGGTPEGLGELDVANGLVSLREREMVYRREASAFDNTGEYIFKHGLLREIAYGSVLRRLRRVYHGLVADWLVEEAGDRVLEHIGLIADHLEAAGRTEEAIEHLLQAGDRARLVYAHEEAIAYYERALEWLKQEEDYQRAARTLMKQGLAYHTAFDYRRSRQAYDQGFELWQRAAEAHPATPPQTAPHDLRVSYFARPQTLDPGAAQWGGQVLEQMFSGLVEITPELDVVPNAARGWELLEGGRKYVFHLRDDIRWSDGRPVTAGDVEYAWRRVLEPSAQAPYAELLYDIKGARAFHRGNTSDPGQIGVRAVDERTLVVELDNPTGYFLQLLGHMTLFPVPRHLAELHGDAWTEVKNLVTNGPFRPRSWKPGESMILERNPHYHGRSVGNLERLQVSLAHWAEWRPELERYEADDLDILDITYFPRAEFHRVRQRHAGDYVSAPLLVTWALVCDHTRPPFDDRRVRQAFAMAADKEPLMGEVMVDWGAPATGGYLPPGMPAYSRGIGLPFDPQRARRLLAEAGYADGRGFPDVVLWISAGPLSSTPCEYVQAQWHDNLGVRISWEEIEGETRDERQQESPPHLRWEAWVADYPDPDNFLRVGVRFWSHWREESYDKLVERARRLSDQGARMRLYAQAEQILVEEAVIIPFCHARQHLLVKPWVKRLATPPTEIHSFRNVIIEPH
jgi:ABC-type oligopeptide transport system substrate-binding subunit/class 3 adenylate cyclase